jgi:hypothetical protein
MGLRESKETLRMTKVLLPYMMRKSLFPDCIRLDNDRNCDSSFG